MARFVIIIRGATPYQILSFFQHCASAPNHPHKGLDPQNQGNAHLNLENSSLKKCPKPFGQGFRPTHPYGQCPNRGDANLKGASLSSSVKSLYILQPHSGPAALTSSFQTKLSQLNALK